MEKYFGKAYRGDPGVPHSGPESFENIWIGAFAFSALTWSNPYMWHLTNQFKISLLYQWHSLTFNNFFSLTFSHFEILTRKLHTSLFLSHIVILRLHINSVGDFMAENGWHDKVMLFEQYHWKKAKAKKQPYKFKWNEYMDRELRDSYYFNWPVYFP